MTDHDALRRVTDHDDLVRRVIERAAADLPCATAAQISEAETLLGFRIPPLLARLYRKVGNGGFGPDYHLLPLIGPEETTAVGTYRAEHASGDWPTGVLPILDWGCAMCAAVDCADPDAPVLLFEPNAVTGDDWSRAWFEDTGSLAAWLDDWLNGTSWYEQDDPQLVPWPQAAARMPSLALGHHHDHEDDHAQEGEGGSEHDDQHEQFQDSHGGPSNGAA
ncbi:SMI1/KNR4 family protein [Actinomadura rupiterrae]|uniref:SMI1/KNR4 family protein n=1 Tax=Actinomadura rupiterrae TaxID=559627 RepID=UPI0020A26F0E|nr:SMI1/KNR4 family protein [Actinomadura rupiterrae]MCP2337863.1 hypothetical protein [Actinomadura rupiterrae]